MFKSAIIALAALASVSVSASPINVEAEQPAKKDSQWGTGTFYYQNGNPGNCGDYHRLVSCPKPSYRLAVLPQ
jgi:hypothetical protein